MYSFNGYSLFQVYEVHQGDLWGRAGSLIPRLRSAQGLFVCGKFIGEPAPTGIYQKIDQDERITRLTGFVGAGSPINSAPNR